jgi:hypothetical protein
MALFCLQHRYDARPDWNDNPLLLPSRCVAVFAATANCIWHRELLYTSPKYAQLLSHLKANFLHQAKALGL